MEQKGLEQNMRDTQQQVRTPEWRLFATDRLPERLLSDREFWSRQPLLEDELRVDFAADEGSPDGEPKVVSEEYDGLNERTDCFLLVSRYPLLMRGYAV